MKSREERQINRENTRPIPATEQIPSAKKGNLVKEASFAMISPMSHRLNPVPPPLPVRLIARYFCHG